MTQLFGDVMVALSMRMGNNVRRKVCVCKYVNANVEVFPCFSLLEHEKTKKSVENSNRSIQDGMAYGGRS